MIEWAVESREEHLALEKGVEYDETDQRSVAFEADGKIHKNLFQALLTSSIPESEKQARRMAHESFEVLLAGTDTTARTMGIILFHVLANPVLCTRLTAEVRNLLPVRSDRVDLAELEALPLLVSCLFSLLRAITSLLKPKLRKTFTESWAERLYQGSAPNRPRDRSSAFSDRTG